MLIELRINQLALVDELVLPLGPGLTMLTGETGAGKSMIAGAMAILSGREVPKDLVRDGEELAWVEGVFDLSDSPLRLAWLERMGVRVGNDGILVLRREIRRHGRNRVLINGLTSSIAVLERIGEAVLAVQSQDQQRELEDPAYARDYLDARLGCEESRNRAAAAWKAWHEAVGVLAERRREEEADREKLDIWTYQRDELAAAHLDPAEEASLDESLALKRHANALSDAAAKALTALDHADAGARATLGRSLAALTPLADVSPRLSDIVALLGNAEAAAADASRDLDRFLDGLDLDPADLDALEERRSIYAELKRKYRRDIPDLLDYLAELEGRIERQQSAVSDIVSLEERVAETAAELVAEAEGLRARRIAGAGDVAREAAQRIRALSLPDLALEFRIAPRIDADSELLVDGENCRITAAGADDVRLLVRTNPGERMGEVADIASGGERSRIHLGLTALRRDRPEPPLLLCDEVDAGLGMDAARPMASMLRELSSCGQVVCISHLPTMAVAGDQHLTVTKQVRDGRTVLSLRKLDGDERIAEVARLLGGAAGRGNQDDDGGSRLAYARDLLAGAQQRAAEKMES